MPQERFDYIIVGAGIVGLAVAHVLRELRPNQSICVIDKEPDIALHASGRNSGVLHAGFYYTADSLKAKFTAEGNQILKAFCREHQLPINECGKLVVATNEQELEQLYELAERGKRNESGTSLISLKEAEEIEPNIFTFEKALYSPNTASVDPILVCRKLKDILIQQRVKFFFDTPFSLRGSEIYSPQFGLIAFNHLINSAGLYADSIAKLYGFGKNYCVLPFKGLYLKYTKNKTDIRTNIYPVPNLNNPFLGVHYTKSVDGSIKIGPTAIPSFWRENYSGFSRFSSRELLEILRLEAKLFLTNSFGFRNLAFEEIRKYNKATFVGLATKLVKSIDINGFTEYTKPGIRAQLVDLTTSRLVQDFLIEGDRNSTHILNAVSPGFTCSFPFAKHVVENYVLK